MKGPFVKFCMCFCFLRCGSCPSTRVSLIATYSRLLRMLLSVSRDGTICSIKHFKCGSKIALCKNRPYTVLYTPVQHIGFFLLHLRNASKVYTNQQIFFVTFVNFSSSKCREAVQLNTFFHSLNNKPARSKAYISDSEHDFTTEGNRIITF